MLVSYELITSFLQSYSGWDAFDKGNQNFTSCLFTLKHSSLNNDRKMIVKSFVNPIFEEKNCCTFCQLFAKKKWFILTRAASFLPSWTCLLNFFFIKMSVFHRCYANICVNDAKLSTLLPCRSIRRRRWQSPSLLTTFPEAAPRMTPFASRHTCNKGTPL